MEPKKVGERATLYQGDCLEVLRTLPDSSVEAVVTDPPAGISFMGKEWDEDKGGMEGWVAWLASVMKEALRVLKPGGYAVVWALPRTSYWTALAIHQAGFTIRDRVSHLYGCLSDDTEILVDGQWEQYQKAVEGRLALCYDVGHDTFSWQPIEKLHIYPYSDTAYHLHSDHTDQLVSRNHRCLVERGGATMFSVAEEVALERQACVPVLEDLPGLLAALPLPHEGVSPKEQDMFVALREGMAVQGSKEASSSSCLPMVQEPLHPQIEHSPRQGGVLLRNLSESTSGSRPERTGTAAPDWGNGTCGMDRGESGILPREDERREESSLEGRGDLLPQAWQLQADQVRPVSTRIHADGSQGWLRDGASAFCGQGDRSLSVASRGGAPQQPRPPRQRENQPSLVREQQAPQAVRASRYTRSDLVRIDPVFYRGLVWCVTVPTGAFVARRNGKVFVTGNSGFPKSLNVSKAIDESLGAEREVVGVYTHPDGRARPDSERSTGTTFGEHSGKLQHDVTAPATDLAKEWEGWGTALKPAVEDWWIARKPFHGTLVANVLKHRTGGLNIDGCRVGSAEDVPSVTETRQSDYPQGYKEDGQPGWGRSRGGMAGDVVDWSPTGGRYPANLVLSHAPGCRCLGTKQVKSQKAMYQTEGKGGMLDVGFGTKSRPVGQEISYADEDGTETVENWECIEGCPIKALNEQGKPEAMVEGDEGGVARFFPNFPATGRWPANLVLSHAPGCKQVGTKVVKVADLVHYTDGVKPFGGGVGHPYEKVEREDEEIPVYECVEGCPVKMLDEQSGDLHPTQGAAKSEPSPRNVNCYGDGKGDDTPHGYSDLGGASRYFTTFDSFHYCAKASRSEREYGCENLESRTGAEAVNREAGSAGLNNPRAGAGRTAHRVKNHHPTVKPIDLMRWLCRLVTPPKGTVLDMFMGSGSTGVAAIQEGFQFIGIEQEVDYLKVAEARILMADGERHDLDHARDAFDFMLDFDG